MNILIVTGIFPPALGGPAQYAKHLHDEWVSQGHTVLVKTFTKVEYAFPSLVRHVYFFFKIIPAVLKSDFIFALDTFSVGWPATIAAKIFRKKIIMRTGGDFLWEGYVERTHDLVLFKNFYTTTQGKWSAKERLIFAITKWTLHHVDILFFSTQWQKDVWMAPYGLDKRHVSIIENYYGKKETSFEPTKKDFVGGTRPLLWKNTQLIKEVFSSKVILNAGATYHSETCSHYEFMDKMAHSYATLLVSLGDISPNMILDSIRHNKPFIITRENGLMDRISTIAVTADPLDARDIEAKVLWLCDKKNYDAQVEKIRAFNFTHSWKEIADEVLELYTSHT